MYRHGKKNIKENYLILQQHHFERNTAEVQKDHNVK